MIDQVISNIAWLLNCADENTAIKTVKSIDAEQAQESSPLKEIQLKNNDLVWLLNVEENKSLNEHVTMEETTGGETSTLPIEDGKTAKQMMPTQQIPAKVSKKISFFKKLVTSKKKLNANEKDQTQTRVEEESRDVIDIGIHTVNDDGNRTM